ncbi:MAG: hypothetical protein ABTQ30_06165, partial [Rhizobiaceae bacterium]
RRWFAAYGATYFYAPDHQDRRFETARHPRIDRPWIPKNSLVISKLSEVAGDAPQPQKGSSAWEPEAPDNLDSAPAQ